MFMDMFRRRGTIIAEGLKIVGSVTAEGLVEVNGHIEGDLHCTSLVVSPKASISGGVEAERVVVNGRVEGPIRGGEVVLKSRAHVVGDIQHQSLAIEAERVVVNGRVEGPIRGGEVLLKSHAHVVGDIQHQSLAIERGAFFDGRSVRSPESNVRKGPADRPERLTARLRRESPAPNGREPAAASAA